MTVNLYIFSVLQMLLVFHVYHVTVHAFQQETLRQCCGIIFPLPLQTLKQKYKNGYGGSGLFKFPLEVDHVQDRAQLSLSLQVRTIALKLAMYWGMYPGSLYEGS